VQARAWRTRPDSFRLQLWGADRERDTVSVGCSQTSRYGLFPNVPNVSRTNVTYVGSSNRILHVQYVTFLRRWKRLETGLFTLLPKTAQSFVVVLNMICVRL
jgi:hypothetical protein